jgi:hypothetical protein
LEWPFLGARPNGARANASGAGSVVVGLTMGY